MVQMTGKYIGYNSCHIANESISLPLTVRVQWQMATRQAHGQEANRGWVMRLENVFDHRCLIKQIFFSVLLLHAWLQITVLLHKYNCYIPVERGSACMALLLFVQVEILLIIH
jgi:hypothetical protein